MEKPQELLTGCKIYTSNTEEEMATESLFSLSRFHYQFIDIQSYKTGEGVYITMLPQWGSSDQELCYFTVISLGIYFQEIGNVVK